MSKWRCNSCGGTYSDTQADGSLYYHVCAGVEHIRNENPPANLLVVDGRMVRATPHPEEPGQVRYTPAEFEILSEGAGRTLLPL